MVIKVNFTEVGHVSAGGIGLLD